MARSPALVKPAHLWIPEHTSSAGDEAIDLARMAGLELDPEQQLVVRSVLAERGDRWAALEAAIIEARQNGKTIDLQAIALAKLFLLDDRLLVWSAHLFTTTQEAHRDLVAIIDGTPEFSRRVKKISNANGDEAIELHGDRRVLFKARTRTGGRGLSGDCVVLDEAGFLLPAMMGSLFPTMSARPNPQIIYAASAGLADSAILRGLRDRGRKGGDPTLVYIEFCAPGPEGACKRDECEHQVGTPGCAADDPKSWRLANPAIARGRITVEFIAAERRALPPEEFVRERLGWWDNPAHVTDGIPLEKWAVCAKRSAKLADPVTLAVDVMPKDVSASIVACGGPVEVIAHERGSAWVVPRIAALVEEHRPMAIGVDPAGPAGALIPDLEKQAGLTVRSSSNPDGLLVLLDAREMQQACGALYAATVQEALVHRDQPILNDAVAGANRRKVGDAWKWSRIDSSVDITPLVAATIARFIWSQPEYAVVLEGELMA